MHADDDSLDFLDEEPADSEAELHSRRHWNVLIVDDDEDVHHATVFALREARILGHPLNFLHAYNSVGAVDILKETADVAVILLDVVMETEDAGLAMIGRIRDELRLDAVRIILRTGQPGYAPDIDAITRYDINDYKTKAELNRARLYTALTAAIRSYDQITKLDSSRRGLELIVDSANRFIAEQGLPTFARGVINQIAVLLGVQPSGLVVVDRDIAHGAVRTGMEILASSGRFDGACGRLPHEGEFLGVAECLSQTLNERRNRVDQGGISLFFADKAGRRFAAYIEAPRHLVEVDEHLLGVFCANISICADNVDLVSRLRQTAYVDGLTQLPNRAALIEAMESELASGNKGGTIVALVDIDQFSETIDILGYRYGDQILVEMARRLRGTMPPDVFVARVSGDVFGVFGPEDVINPAILREILSDPLMIEDGAQTISISLGFVRVAEDMRSGADLLRYAAIALKRAKADGVGRESYYTPEVAVETRERVRLLQDLRVAFNRNSLFVVFQPQVDLATGHILGVEALLRWRTEDGSFVSPDRFIPVAEQSGFIVALGAWVLRNALRTLKTLEAQGYPMRMAVNVSAIQFRHPGFLDMLDEALAETSTATHLLELEITESVAMFGQSDFEERLQAVKARGVRVAIDDFGTGFSSLSYLDRLAADCLKIDRSFVWALDSKKSGARIAEMVIGLGRRLGMRVLAEGVETEEQAAALRQMGCDEAQGWLYGKPITQEELIEWLGRR